MCCSLQAGGSVLTVPRPMGRVKEGSSGEAKAEVGKGVPGRGNGLGKGLEAQRRLGVYYLLTEWEGRGTGDQVAE